MKNNEKMIKTNKSHKKRKQAKGKEQKRSNFHAKEEEELLRDLGETKK